ncbi:autoinducer binding domain-containing protein [Caballeronia sp. SBC2]|uniref:autoinducer binding domain-containing protein n=1 Tax=Caballeronia sp. SBC2 TaxID=2705547 RepID=UPI0013E16DB5|nr:autoinducer binding domain-containing protein [Caballeronia sp. SBC2]QIE30481.1 Autoinducer binding domain protein [Caballeronia sp. SBC2]
MSSAQPVTLFLGHETVRLSASNGSLGHLIERESFASEQQLGPKITQVVLANDASIREFLKGDPHSERVGPVVDHLLREAHYVSPKSFASVDIRDQLKALNHLYRAEDETELMVCITSLVQTLGATSFMYFLAEDDANGRPVSYRILTSHAEALQNYVSLRYYATDPFLIRSRHSPEPFFSSDFGMIENMRGQRREIAERARAMGMKSWIVVPAHCRGSNNFGTLYVANNVLPADGGEECLRESQALFRSLSAQVFEWYMKKEVALAFANTRLSTFELQILSARKRGFTLELIADILNLSPTALKRVHVPSINHKLKAKNIHEATKIADDQGLLTVVSDRKVAYVIYSESRGIFLRADHGCPFFSKMLAGDLQEAQIFDDRASARELIDRVMPNQKDVVQLRRVDVHCFATTATKEECVAAGMPAWESEAEPAEVAEWPTHSVSSGSYH